MIQYPLRPNVDAEPLYGLRYVYPFTTGWPPPPVPHPTRTKEPHTDLKIRKTAFFSRSFPPVTAQRLQPNDQRNAKNPQSLARHRCAQRFQFRSPPRACNVLTPCPVLFFFFSLKFERTQNENTQEPRVVSAWRSRRTFSLAVTMLSPRGDLPRSFAISYRTLPSIKRGCARWRST